MIWVQDRYYTYKNKITEVKYFSVPQTNKENDLYLFRLFIKCLDSARKVTDRSDVRPSVLPDAATNAS